MEFPDVSSFPRHSPYRGYGGWPFENRVHHLMRSFHPSDTNIAEGSIFYPLGEKILENLLDLYSRLRPRGCEKMIYVFSQPLLYT